MILMQGKGVSKGVALTQYTLAIGIDELSVSPTSVLPLRAEIRKSIAKTCTLERLEV